MKKPKVERGPNVSMPIRQPHTTITSGVRHVGVAGNWRTSPSVATMEISSMVGVDRKDSDERARYETAGKSKFAEVNAWAWKPQPASSPNFPPHCSVAIQSRQL